MGKVSVMGSSGFIGNRFCEMFSKETIRIDKHSLDAETNIILSFVSTTDNYNVFSNPTLDFETNVILLIKMLERAKNKFGSNFCFIFISSWFTYGDQPLPITEESNQSPNGMYAISKYSAEMVLRSYCETFGIKYLILRLGNVFGPGDKGAGKKKNALQYLINEMKAGNDIALYGGGEFTRDYMYVDDVCSGIKLCIDKAEPNQAVHVASGNPYKFKDLIYYCHDKLQSKSKIDIMEPTNFHKVVQTKDNWLDNSKITALGFKPQYDVWRGLDKILYGNN